MSALLEPTPAGLLRGGAPHRVISGAVHYFRIHPDLWRDRLLRLVALGCDTVETYVAWNVHQPAPGVTTFEGFADLGRFLDIAQELGLDAIVRPGPYICAEWENGGFPGWLLADRDLALRTSDPRYLAAVDAWFDELIPVIAARQASRGGNVVMVQVENEYGSFGDDRDHLEHLRDGLRVRGIDELLVTSDGPGREWLTGGTVEGAWATLNFGSRALEALEMASVELPDQPQMCMEFWNGWFDHWGERHHVRDAADAARELSDMLEHGMSVNLYMAHGGTNFGLRAGANFAERLQPTTTSYDYDAPIAEDGTLTEKFRAFREVIGRYRELPPLAEHLEQLGIEAAPAHLPAAELTIERTASLHGTGLLARPGALHPRIPSFEDLGLERGMLRASRDIEIEVIAASTDSADGAAGADGASDGARLRPLELWDLHDRAWVWVDGIFAGVVGGEVGTTERHPACEIVELTPLLDRLLPERGELGGSRRTVRVDLLVENLGRANFGQRLGERKGILGGVWREPRFLNGWEVDPWPLEDMGEELAALVARAADGATPADRAPADGATPADGADGPVLIAASFEAAPSQVADTFLDVSAAGHGVAYVNGFCVGRYWHVGPQQTLYVPAPLLREGRNEVVLLEMEQRPARLALVEEHLFDTPTGGPAETV
ncbi:glycoside hydrolase family 35 protein [Brachybacterium sp. DNPG3]